MGILDKIRELKARKNKSLEKADIQQSAVVHETKPEPKSEPKKSPADIFVDNMYEKIDKAKFSPEEATKEALKAEIKEEFSNLSKEMKEEVKSALWSRWENYDRISRYDDPRCWGASDTADKYMALHRLVKDR